MILTNRLNFFDKRGNELNMLPDAGVSATVIDPANVGGFGATFNVYTERDGSISVLEIVTPGKNYSTNGVAFIRFENIITETYWDTDPADLSIDLATGSIIGSTIPLVPSDLNKGFPYPAVSWRGEMYFDMVSTGLIENQDIFVLENVLISNPTTPKQHSFPRADEGVTLSIGELGNTKAQISPASSKPDGVGTIRVQTFTGIANSTNGDDIIYGVGVGVSVTAGMTFEGLSFPVGTTIAEVLSANSIRLSNTATANLTGFSWTAYVPHGFIAGMIIKVNNATYPELVGNFTVTQVSDQYIYFNTPKSIPALPTIFNSGTYNAVPVWRGRIAGREDQIFMYTVDFGVDYPTITKVNNLVYDPVDGTFNTDFYYSNTTVFNNLGNYQTRIVNQELVEEMMSFHLGFSAETEGSYIRLFILEDITYPYAPALIAQISLRGEAEGLDERLGLLLENFGRDVTSEQELIMRDSDVNEDFTDNRLLNRKRKEMLLQGDQIWPYLGSYRGLVNIVNWFGYYDIRIKEYWLNVNSQDAYFGKYKQLQIPFQLEERGTPYNSISMLPNTVYSKTNKFGLFYDITKETGVLDEYGVPLTADAFQFSNEEILIKLFALKQYLLNNFLPLNTQIVDIVGEGVYYERYAANSWNDRVNQTVVDLSRSIDFEADSTYTQIVDSRAYNAELKAYVPTPGLSSIVSYYSTYTIKGVNITSSTNTTSIPQITLYTAGGTGSPSTYWVGEPFVKAAVGVYPVTASGIGYLVGDVITLRGGTFERPIRVKVLSVTAGAVTSIQILSGTDQGSGYFALSSGFSQLSVVSQDLVNNLYYSGVGAGFQIDYTDIQYVLEGIKTTTFGKGYPINDVLTFDAYDANAAAAVAITYDFITETVTGPNVGNFDASAQLQPLTNEPNIPVAAPLNLSALGFDITWGELAFSWQDLWSASDASLLAYIDALPAGSGGVIAIEILDVGDGYSSVPTIQFNGGEGLGSTAQAKLTAGELQLFELEVSSIVPLSPTTSRVNLVNTFPIPPAYVPYSIGTMVTGTDSAGNSLQKPAVIIFVDVITGAYFDINVNFTSAIGNMFVKVHEGAIVTASGSGYSNTPYVKTVGGHTSTLYTYDEIGRGNFYEMEWKVTSEEGTANFIYSTGQKSIDELVNHKVELPYIGKYKVELIVYDTDNNWINEIKRNYVEAYLPQALPGMVTRFIGPSYAPGEPFEDGGTGSESNLLQLSQNCVDTWDEAFYHWDEYWGRWVNPIKTWTTWNDCDVEWSTLEITPLSAENNWTYPAATEYEVLKVSAYDVPIGSVTSFIPKTVYASTTAGSNVLTNVSNYNYSVLLFGGFQIGDSITVAGITTTITNINYVNSTITTVALATSTETNVRAHGSAQFVINSPSTLNPRPDFWQAMPTVQIIYLRKDANIYQLGLTSYASTVSLGVLTLFIDDVSVLPKNFDYTYSEWELLLEVNGTILLADDHFTPGTPATLTPGQYITLKGNSDTPLNDSRWNASQPPSQWGIPIDLKGSTSGYSSPFNQITFNNYFPSTNDFDTRPWINGQIYQYRNGYSVNGSLDFVRHADPAKTVYIERLESPTEENWGNRAMIYINATPSSTNRTTANPMDEIRPGFTIIDLLIGDDPGIDSYKPTGNSILGDTFQPRRITTTEFFPQALPAGGSVWSIRPGGTNINLYNTVTLTNTVIVTGVQQHDLTYAESIDNMYVSDNTNVILAYDAVGVLNPAKTLTATAAAGSLFNIKWIKSNPASILYPEGLLFAAPRSGSSFVSIFDVDTSFELFSIDVSPYMTLCGGIEYNPANDTIWVTPAVLATGQVVVIDADPVNVTFGTIIANITPAVNTNNFGAIKYIPASNKMYVLGNGVGGWQIYDASTYSNSFFPNTVGLGGGTISTLQSIAYDTVNDLIWFGSSVPNGVIWIFDPVALTFVNSFYSGTNNVDSTTWDPVSDSVWIGVFRPGIIRLEQWAIDQQYLGKGETLYQQHFRTINMYEDTSTQGYPWSIWSNPIASKIICIEVVTLDGKKFDEDYYYLDQVTTFGTQKGWIEYKYEVFPTRVNYIPNTLPNLELNLDENTRPVSDDFSTSTYFPATPLDGRGWYYDHAISKGDYSFEVVNVGAAKLAGNYTIVTVKDPESQLFQCDATYKQLARDFDEESSNKHLGVKFEWDEASNLEWSSLCSQTWTTLDWTYNLSANFKFNQTIPNTPVSLQFNKYEPYITNLFALNSQFGYTTPFLVSLLNNNFYDSTSTWSKNDNPGISKFYYVAKALDPAHQLTAICTWGDPSSTDLTFLTSTSVPLSNNEIACSAGIQPGWEVSASTSTIATLTASGAWSIGGSIPWIPACTIHGSFKIGSNKVTNIVGYPASLPQGGWLWDYNALIPASVGKFGPGIGSVVIENGFITAVTMDNPSAFTADNFSIEIYPQYSGIVEFWNPSQGGPGNEVAPIISAYAKNPGADSLGFIKTTNTGGIGFIANNDYLNADVTLPWSHTFPLGNYYNWVQDPAIFYGGGLENSLLQFAYPYRNIQTYIQEGGSGRQYNADGGGWYPSIDWGSYQGFVDGAYAFGSNNENLYNPIVKVTMVDSNGNAIVNDAVPGPNDFYLVLNRSFDGENVIYETNTNQPFDFTNSLVFSTNPVDAWPVPIILNIADYEGDGHSSTVNGVVVNPFDGIIGKKAVYMQADYDTNPALLYDYPAYQLTNIVSSPIQTASNPSASLFEGMYMGYLFGTAFGSGTNHNNTRIATVDGTTINLTDKQILGTGTGISFYAYVPLSLNLRVQPMNLQIWSRTKQSDSMRLLYEQSMSSAFTWEDTTISLKEKKIPAGTSVLFTSDPSDIAGKTLFKWNLYYEGAKVTSLTNPNFLWTFMEVGLYDIELEITDTNGNKQSKYNPEFVEVYLAN